MKKKLILPNFKNETEEHEFWSKIDLSDYYEVKDFKSFDAHEFYEKYLKPEKPKTTRITIRVPSEIVKRYKDKALKEDVPYQILMKQELAKGIAESEEKEDSRKIPESAFRITTTSSPETLPTVSKLTNNPSVSKLRPTSNKLLNDYKKRYIHYV